MNRPAFRWYGKPFYYTLALMYGTLSSAIFTGCGGSEPAPATTQPAPQPVTPAPAAPPPQVAQNTQTTSVKKTEQQDDGRKMIDGIPYDVWFDNPLAVAGNQQSVTPVALPGNTVAATPTNPAPATEMKTADTPAAASGGADWKTIIPMPVLDSLVKDIRNRLTKNMQSVGTYNTTYLELPTFTSTLATLAGIASEHPDEIGWKKNAKYLRDLSAGISSKQLMRGAKSYREIQIPYEQMIVIMNGSLPAGVPDSKDKIPFSDVASMGDLMKRIDIASKWLKSNVGNADALKSEKEKVIEEAHLLAAIAKVITTEGYGYVDDNGFLGHANPMQEASLQMVQAAKDDNFPEFDKGLTRVYKACTECHSEYKE
ncbi:hypothetical protein CA11_29940 [Gimesia maris]|uniref:hypothetical protein n=1 Tax=Gimesia maris TaxID=122 RepID=UPI00118ACD4A|nr:hypothetical protein [Gimesia maris]QDU15174.1 hypothetical protein CA11_29940 [Gimesia maris]